MAVGPNAYWLFTDEHEDTIDDGYFMVTMNDSSPFVSLVAFRHQRGYELSFADGHVEPVRIQDPLTLQSSQGKQYSRLNADWIRLKQMTTVRWNK